MRLTVRAHPRAAHERVAWDGSVLDVWVHAPAAEGAANQAVVAGVARWLGVAPGRVRIARGARASIKLVDVEGIEVRPRACMRPTLLSVSEPNWREIGAGVLVRRHDHLHLNVGLVVGADEVMLVDTRSWASQARELRAAVREVTDLPIRHVVNTHGHFDHCFGNEQFLDASIWAHPGCAVELRAYGEIQRAAMMDLMPEHRSELAAVRICLPTHLVDEAAEVTVGGRSVLLQFFGRAHTDHDLCVVVPDAEVVFAGDVFEQSAPPSFHDAWPLEWGGTAGRIAQLGAGQVVPGHGEVMDPDDVRTQTAELVRMGELCERVIAGELSPRQAIATAPFPEEFATVAVGRAWVSQPNGRPA